MQSKKESYRILHQNGVATNFHVIDSDMVPFANFDIAYRWYKEGVLTLKSELEISEIMSDPKVEERYSKFLAEEHQIILARQKKRAASEPLVI